MTVICNLIAASIGRDCQVLDEDGRYAVIATPLRYSDGDPVPVFLDCTSGMLRFCDDGGTIFYLLGCGMGLDCDEEAIRLAELIGRHGAALNDAGEVEIAFALDDAQPAFERFLAAMGAVVAWETEWNTAGVN
jgi:hypothetical protein